MTSRVVKNETPQFMNKKVAIYNNAKTVVDGTLVDVKNYNYIILDVVRCTRSALKPMASIDNVNWVTADAISLKSGNLNETIYHNSNFLINVSGYNYFKLPILYIQHPTFSSVTVSAILTNEDVSVPVKSNKIYRPNPLNPKKEITETSPPAGQFRATDITKDAIYGIYSRRIVKTEDNGVTFTELYNHYKDGTEAYPSVAKKLGDGSVLAGFKFGEVFKITDEVNGTVKKVLDMPAGYIGMDTISVYDNLVLVAEYGDKATTDNPTDAPRRAWISTDYGDNFELFFSVEPRKDSHIHSIKYDPYQDIIWIAIGDTESSNVFWSINRGISWNRVYEWGECPNQWTAILPLANCVLFLSDNPHMSVYKWERNNGIENQTGGGSNIEIEVAYSFARDTFSTEPLGQYGYVDYDNSVAYFGYLQLLNDQKLPSIIYATADGERFYPIYNSQKIPNGPNGGITGVVGCSETGKVLATEVDNDQAHGKLVLIDTPNWVEI